MAQVFDGITVLDFTSGRAGGVATMVMSDFGARFKSWLAARQQASTATELITTVGMEPYVGRAPNAAPLRAAQADEQRCVSEMALIPGHPARRITSVVLDFGVRARVQQRLDHLRFIEQHREMQGRPS